jgi:putative spermidine/putrescine transport system ATP-binding protein
MSILARHREVVTEVTQPALSMKGVTRTFGNLVAVDAIDLELRKGEFMTLLGPSGSGKTTTLNMVAGFLQPTAGRVLIDGRDATKTPPHKRGIGMVFQNYALFPHLTVAQNIAFPLVRMPMAEQKSLVREVLHLVGLEGLEQRLPRQLSGGQQQRVAFARAIVYRPRLLLMDEPFGALDKKLREALQLEIRRLHLELAITILHVTHDQDEALILSDRIAVFRRGCIEQLGTPRDLYDHPKTVFVADFIGEANIFRGIVSDGGQRITIKGEGWCLYGEAPLNERIAAGSQASLVVRPDRLSLVPVGSPPSAGKQRILARVRQVVYLGGALKYELEALGQTIYARPAAEVFEPDAGQEVSVEWLAEHGIIVPGA